nr:MAG TPA: hypothetical protein [Caudoviricetes sp.]
MKIASIIENSIDSPFRTSASVLKITAPRLSLRYFLPPTGCLLCVHYIAYVHGNNIQTFIKKKTN